MPWQGWAALEHLECWDLIEAERLINAMAGVGRSRAFGVLGPD